MEIEIITCTANPMAVISLAAGICYGKHDVSERRVRNCYKSGHMSVFEHPSVTFKASGISRASSHQLVRHRLASFSQMSQRYCKVDTASRDWYVMPKSFSGDDAEWFDDMMAEFACVYRDAIDADIKPEDARYLLPEATKTEIVVTMNARELFHFLDLRQSKAAQWEIRELANMLEEKLLSVDGWRDLIEMRRG